MAGFSQIGGSPMQSLAPPRLDPIGTSGFMRMLVPNQPRDYAGFYGDIQGANASADNSPEHQQNAFMARAGLGNVGNTNYSPAESPYGYSAQDYNAINSFMLNPLDAGNSSAYSNIVNRQSNPMQYTGQFANYTPGQFQQTMRDMPIRMSLGFGNIPPPALQNIGIGLPQGFSGMRW